jgi:hypothetical protein
MYPKREDVTRECRNCTVRKLIICTVSQILDDHIKGNKMGVCSTCGVNV